MLTPYSVSASEINESLWEITTYCALSAYARINLDKVSEKLEQKPLTKRREFLIYELNKNEFIFVFNMRRSFSSFPDAASSF